jgi:integrase
VTVSDIERVIDAAPNQDWRMVLTLCRHAGLRCPSEVLSLRWQDIQWDNKVMKVSSPKTEQHDGKESRIVPLYRRVREELERSFEMASEGAEYVVSNPRWRQSAMSESGWRNCNLRTQF